MTDDWQDSQFSNRHVHSRVGKHSRGIKGKANAAFDVHRTFGSYEIKCPAAAKLMKSEQKEGAFEIYCLNETQDALIARLILPGVLDANVVLAGSRKTMSKVIEGLLASSEEVEPMGEPAQDVAEISDEAGKEMNKAQSDAGDGDEDDDEVDENDEEDNKSSEEDEPSANDNFEKNSFRSPKFWVRWQGSIIAGSAEESEDNTKLSEGTGYFIFAGNDCKKFQGTLSVPELEFDNVKITGWRIAGKPERDFDIDWSRVE